MLIKRSKEKTQYILPVMFKKNNYRTYFYYDTEYLLFKAYYQLLSIKGNIIVFYPIIDDLNFY